MRVGINQSCQMGQTGFKILCDRFLTRLPYIVICRMIPQSTTVTKHPQLSGLSEQPFCLLLIWQSGPSSVRPFFCWARPWRPAACSWVSSGLGPARVLGCLALSIQFHSISSTWPLHVSIWFLHLVSSMVARLLGQWLRASKIAEVEAARPSEGLGPGLSEHHFHHILLFQASCRPGPDAGA